MIQRLFMGCAVGEQLLSDLRDASSILVVTGAGISVASGIAPFRGSDPDAVWNRDVMEKGTVRYFMEDTVGSWLWYGERFDGIYEKEPNPAQKMPNVNVSFRKPRGRIAWPIFAPQVA